jgi:hypothetical protein
MTEVFDPSQHRVAEPRWFEDLAVGERFFIPSRTVTEAHFASFQTISADNHPIHYDIEYCRQRGHNGPLAHGFQILSFTAAGAGTFAHTIGDALIAFCRAIVEISEAGLCRRHALSHAGDSGVDVTALDRRRYAQSDRAQPRQRARPIRRTENPAAQAVARMTISPREQGEKSIRRRKSPFDYQPIYDKSIV